MDLHFAEAGAPVPPIQIECHWRDSAPVLRRLRVVIVSLK
jgi:hypothetical protein